MNCCASAMDFNRWQHSFLRELRSAASLGAMLAVAGGCGTTVGGGDGAGGAGGEGGGGGGESAGTAGGPEIGGGTAVGSLEEPPDLVCSGPIHTDPDDGYSGQCCEIVTCGPTVNGVCASAFDALDMTNNLSNYPPGSGECSCSDLRGPYRNTEDPNGELPCCYLVGEIGCEGRPLIIAGEVRLAPIVRRGIARKLRRGPSAEYSAYEREALAAAWSRRAQFEHASIASFARFTMQLLSIGAPPELVDRAQRATGEELRHAMSALGIASSLAGEALAFGDLDIAGAPVQESLGDIVVATVIEGCVGETIAAMEARACADEALDPEIREALSRIALEESEHAALAWAFVGWALARDPSLAGTVRTAFQSAFAAAAAPPEEALPDAVQTGHGFLAASEIRSLRASALREVLKPAVVSLLASRSAPLQAMCA